MKILFAIFVYGLVMVAGSAVMARSLGVFGDWQAHTDGKGKQRTCWMYSEPKKHEGKYTKRGRIHVAVGHRLSDKSYHQVQFTAGYTFRKDSVVTVTIGSQKFELFTHADTAWTHNANQDRALSRAMRAGNQMVVVGYSSRGTETTDTYSLTGFTAAHNAINKACGVKAMS